MVGRSVAGKMIGVSALLVSLGVIWATLIPVVLGGTATYVITSGISMQPEFHSGDLAILRQASEYRVGDVVAYEDPRIGRVLHRIIQQNGDRFTMKGDNNRWLDTHQPAADEIDGKLWLHIPGAGRWLEKVRRPETAMLLAIVAGAVVAAPARAYQQRKRRLRGRVRSGKQPSNGGKKSGRALGPNEQAAFACIAVISLLSLMIGVFAFFRPIERSASTELAYQHSATFQYTAQSSEDIYPDGLAHTGQPVYRALTDWVEFTIDYQFSTDSAYDIRGTYQLAAIIEREDGWSRTMPLASETPFEGGRATITGVLDLDQAQSVIDTLVERVGATSESSAGYAISIVPAIQVAGRVAGHDVQEVFAPSLAFNFNDVALSIVRDSAVAPDSQSDFTLTRDGSVSVVALVANEFPVLMFDVTVSSARRLSLIGMVVSCLGGAALLLVVRRAQRIPEPARIRARYQPLLITLKGSDLGVVGRIIEVASIDDLARVAEREGRMILHQQQGGTHDYFVQDVDVTYRYRTSVAQLDGAQAVVEIAQ